MSQGCSAFCTKMKSADPARWCAVLLDCFDSRFRANTFAAISPLTWPWCITYESDAAFCRSEPRAGKHFLQRQLRNIYCIRQSPGRTMHSTLGNSLGEGSCFRCEFVNSPASRESTRYKSTVMACPCAKHRQRSFPSWFRTFIAQLSP